MDSEIINIIKNSKTFREILLKLNKRDTGSNYKWLKKIIFLNNIDITHILNKSEYNKLNYNKNKFKKIDDDLIFSENTNVSRGTIKKRIISNKLIKYECKFCKNEGQWDGKKISLILDHINGIPTDNRIENLRFLCPNCNATLETHCIGYRGLLKKQKCKSPRKLTLNSRINMRKVIRPDQFTLKTDIEKLGYVQTGKKYGVSDNAIRKWIKQYQKYL